MSAQLQYWPGNHVTAAGNKKPMPTTFNRPWQQDFPARPTQCVFETDAKRAAAHLTHKDPDGESWFVINSDFAPESPHWLIIPETCWEPEKLRYLGGEEKIRSAVFLAQLMMDSDEPTGILCFSIQVGALAAQNQRHTHYHLYKPNYVEPVTGSEQEILPLVNPSPIQLLLPNDPDLFIFEHGGLQVTAGGILTGQSFITPTHPFPFSVGTIRVVAHVLARLIDLYTDNFETPEGLAPDYRFELEFHNGYLNFGIFIPKLNNTGTLEDMALIDPRRCMNLAWSHQETAKYLRERR